MADISNQPAEGLLNSLKNLSLTVIAMIHTRLELIGTDLEEGRERFISLLAMAFVSLFTLCFGAVLLSIFIVVVFWDTHRLLVLGSLTGVFLITGAVLGAIVLKKLKSMPKMFEATLAELVKDHHEIDISR